MSSISSRPSGRAGPSATEWLSRRDYRTEPGVSNPRNSVSEDLALKGRQRGFPTWCVTQRDLHRARKKTSSAPSGREVFFDRFLGLKPQAPSYSPFGTATSWPKACAFARQRSSLHTSTRDLHSVALGLPRNRNCLNRGHQWRKESASHLP
jgi:hypothetical protein